MQKPRYFLRYGLIIRLLKAKKNATFEEISDFLNRQSEYVDFDLNISKRTFDRDKNEILSLFKILIEYDFSKKAYYIKEEEGNEHNDSLIEAFDIFNALNMNVNLEPFIVFEKRKPLGTENIYGLLHAIKNKFVIRFSYTKFWGENSSERIVEPYLLKESRYRWYLVALDLKDNQIKTFGIDRLFELEITKRKFINPITDNPNELFKDCYGIFARQGAKAEDVILSFTPLQGRYIKSLPLHDSQQVIFENESEVRVKLKIQISEDFLKELLSFGDEIKILEPQSLKTRICGIFENAIIKNK